MPGEMFSYTHLWVNILKMDDVSLLTSLYICNLKLFHVYVQFLSSILCLNSSIYFHNLVFFLVFCVS
jgi:hypothetical protein